MARPYSQDLRERVVSFVASGATCRAAAERFGVGVATAVRWSHRYRTTGAVSARPMGGCRRTVLAGQCTLPLAAALWITCALLPTLAAWGWYAAHGYNQAFVYANFLSIFDRVGWPVGKLIERLAKIVGLAFPLLLCAWLESVTARHDESDTARSTRRFALAWLAAAIGGVLVFSTFYTHYFLPVLVPLCLVAANLLADRTAGVTVVVLSRHRRLSFAAFVALTASVCIALSLPKQLKDRGKRADIQAVADAIGRYRTGCMLVFDGEPILYHLTDACLVTSHIFPNHLNDAIEDGATGIDVPAELRRILQVERPDIIVATDRPNPRYIATTLRLLHAGLQRDYRLVYQRRIGGRQRLVYKRKGTRCASSPNASVGVAYCRDVAYFPVRRS